MFGKLLKYEFKSLGKWYLSLYAIVGVLSLILGFWIQTLIHRAQNNAFYDSQTNTEGILFGITIFTFAIVITGLLFSTFFLVVSRFYNNIYSRQGYLTMTLPVTGHQILLSKLLAAFIWYILAGLVLLISATIIFSIAVPSEGIKYFLEEYGAVFHTSDFRVLIQFLFNALVQMISGILLTYLSISLGQLFKDHRILMAILFYFGINFAIGIFETIIMISALPQMVYASNLFETSIFTIGLRLLLIPIFYFGTHYIMTKKLNLQ